MPYRTDSRVNSNQEIVQFEPDGILTCIPDESSLPGLGLLFSGRKTSIWYGLWTPVLASIRHD